MTRKRSILKKAEYVVIGARGAQRLSLLLRSDQENSVQSPSAQGLEENGRVKRLLLTMEGTSKCKKGKTGTFYAKLLRLCAEDLRMLELVMLEGWEDDEKARLFSRAIRDLWPKFRNLQEFSLKVKSAGITLDCLSEILCQTPQLTRLKLQLNSCYYLNLRPTDPLVVPQRLTHLDITSYLHKPTQHLLLTLLTSSSTTLSTLRINTSFYDPNDLSDFITSVLPVAPRLVDCEAQLQLDGRLQSQFATLYSHMRSLKCVKLSGVNIWANETLSSLAKLSSLQSISIDSYDEKFYLPPAVDMMREFIRETVALKEFTIFVSIPSWGQDVLKMVKPVGDMCEVKVKVFSQFEGCWKLLS